MKILLSTSTIYKLLLSVLMVTMLSGCVTKYVYVEAQCPHIEVMSTVPTISGPIAEDGTVSPGKLDELLKGCADLRKRTNYYELEISSYNLEYNTSK